MDFYNWRLLLLMGCFVVCQSLWMAKNSPFRGTSFYPYIGTNGPSSAILSSANSPDILCISSDEFYCALLGAYTFGMASSDSDVEKTISEEMAWFEQRLVGEKLQSKQETYRFLVEIGSMMRERGAEGMIGPLIDSVRNYRKTQNNTYPGSGEKISPAIISDTISKSLGYLDSSRLSPSNHTFRKEDCGLQSQCSEDVDCAEGDSSFDEIGSEEKEEDIELSEEDSKAPPSPSSDSHLVSAPVVTPAQNNHHLLLKKSVRESLIGSSTMEYQMSAQKIARQRFGLPVSESLSIPSTSRPTTTASHSSEKYSSPQEQIQQLLERSTPHHYEHSNHRHHHHNHHQNERLSPQHSTASPPPAEESQRSEPQLLSVMPSSPSTDQSSYFDHYPSSVQVDLQQIKKRSEISWNQLRNSGSTIYASAQQHFGKGSQSGTIITPASRSLAPFSPVPPVPTARSTTPPSLGGVKLELRVPPPSSPRESQTSENGVDGAAPSPRYSPRRERPFLEIPSIEMNTSSPSMSTSANSPLTPNSRETNMGSNNRSGDGNDRRMVGQAVSRGADSLQKQFIPAVTVSRASENDTSSSTPEKDSSVETIQTMIAKMKAKQQTPLPQKDSLSRFNFFPSKIRVQEVVAANQTKSDPVVSKTAPIYSAGEEDGPAMRTFLLETSSLPPPTDPPTALGTTGGSVSPVDHTPPQKKKLVRVHDRYVYVIDKESHPS